MAYTHTNGASVQEPIDLHDLSLLFMICALGSIADLTHDPVNDETRKYYVLAKAALSLKSIFANATLSTIQALQLMNAYSHFLGRPSRKEEAWLTYNIINSLAVSVSLLIICPCAFPTGCC